MYFSNPVVSSTTIMGNTATAPSGSGIASGGGVYALDSAPSLDSNIIIENSGDSGDGGIDLVNSSATVSCQHEWDRIKENK